MGLLCKKRVKVHFPPKFSKDKWGSQEDSHWFRVMARKLCEDNTHTVFSKCGRFTYTTASSKPAVYLQIKVKDKKINIYLKNKVQIDHTVGVQCTVLRLYMRHCYSSHLIYRLHSKFPWSYYLRLQKKYIFSLAVLTSLSVTTIQRVLSSIT